MVTKYSHNNVQPCNSFSPTRIAQQISLKTFQVVQFKMEAFEDERSIVAQLMMCVWKSRKHGKRARWWVRGFTHFPALFSPIVTPLICITSGLCDKGLRLWSVIRKPEFDPSGLYWCCSCVLDQGTAEAQFITEDCRWKRYHLLNRALLQLYYTGKAANGMERNCKGMNESSSPYIHEILL